MRTISVRLDDGSEARLEFGSRIVQFKKIVVCPTLFVESHTIHRVALYTTTVL